MQMVREGVPSIPEQAILLGLLPPEGVESTQKAESLMKIMELLEKSRLREHDRVPYYKGTAIITLSEYEAALRAQRDAWRKAAAACMERVKAHVTNGEKDAAAAYLEQADILELCANDIDPDGRKR